jgi:hypothetical protein
MDIAHSDPPVSSARPSHWSTVRAHQAGHPATRRVVPARPDCDEDTVIGNLLARAKSCPSRRCDLGFAQRTRGVEVVAATRKRHGMLRQAFRDLV